MGEKERERKRERSKPIEGIRKPHVQSMKEFPSSIHRKLRFGNQNQSSVYYNPEKLNAKQYYDELQVEGACVRKWKIQKAQYDPAKILIEQNIVSNIFNVRFKYKWLVLESIGQYFPVRR